MNARMLWYIRLYIRLIENHALNAKDGKPTVNSRDTKVESYTS